MDTAEARVFEAVAAAVGGSLTRAPWGWAILALLVTAFVKLRPIMAKIAADREQSLLTARAQDNADLKERVDALEAKLEADRARHEAERSLDRHRINNLNACLDALLLLLETAPEKAAQHVARIKEMRARQMQDESQEKATVQAAVVTAAAGVKP